MSDETRSRSTPPDEGAGPPDGSDGREGTGRGFLGRLLGAFSADPTDGVDPHGSSGAPTPGVLNLRRMRVDDVAVPMVEIVAAPLNIPLHDLTEMFRDHGFSRIPVYRDTLDQPLGLIHLKDLALRHGFGNSPPEGFQLRPMLRPLLYVPPSMPIGILLQQMQRERTHMALVIDEYGGVDGLLTIEDLIEQVLGQIEDEHDELAGHMWTLERPGQWLIQARAPLSAVETETGLDLVPDAMEDEVDTLGGLVVLLAGRVPAVGEIVAHPLGPTLEVVEADARRVKRVRVRAEA